MSKKYYLLAFFSEESNNKLMNIQKELGVDSFAGVNYPHLTLGEFDKELDYYHFVSVVNEYARTHFELDIHIGSVGVHKKSHLFAMANMSNSLLQMRLDLLKDFDNYSVFYSSLKSEIGWSPHITLCNDKSGNKINKLIEIFDETTIKISSIAISYYDGLDYNVLKRFSLKSKN